MSTIDRADVGVSPVSLLRLTIVGGLAILAPLAIGAGIAFARPDHQWTFNGFGPFIGVWLSLVLLAAIAARIAATEPIAVGAMSGIAFAVGSIMRSGSVVGAGISIAAGLLGGWLAGRGMPRRPRPAGGLVALLIVCVVFGTAIAAFARVDVGAAARAVASGDVLAVSAPREFGERFVFMGSRRAPFGRAPFEGGAVVHLRRVGVGSWRAEEVTPVAQMCWLADGLVGSEISAMQLGRTSPGVGAFVAAADTERGCYVRNANVVVGVAPRAAATMEGTTASGKTVPLPLAESRAYILDVGEFARGSPITRITFRDRRGALLESRGIGFGTQRYIEYVEASKLIRIDLRASDPHPHTVIVSSYILTPAEYESLCHRKPPYGEGFVSIGFVRRDDGVSREVVIGTGEPLSSYHPTPDPPYVHAATRPCFFPG